MHAKGRSLGLRRGMTLLEVVVALLILGFSGIGVIRLAHESSRALTRIRGSEEELRHANVFMSVATLWPRGELDQRLGSRPQGSWRLLIARPRVDLYTLILSDSATGRVLLTTSVYRAVPRDATTETQ